MFANLTSPPPSFRSPDVGDGGRRDRGRADGGVEPSNAGISLDDLILRRRSVGEGGTNVGIFSPPPSPPRGSGSRKKRGRPIKLKTSPTTRSSDDDEEEMDPQSERGARGSGDDGGDNFKRGRANKSNPLAKLAETAREAADAAAASPLTRRGYGRVPEYVRRRREEEEEKRLEKEKEKAMANIPAGMRVMPEDEREATLTILRANRADVEAKLAALPIATGQTQTSTRRKSELETRLAEIEDAQRVFQRRVVLVRDE